MTNHESTIGRRALITEGIGREFGVSDWPKSMFEGSWLGIAPEVAARSNHRAAARNKSEIELGVDAKLAAIAMRLSPGLAQRLAEVTT